MSRASYLLLALASFLLPPLLRAAPHPVHDDGGAVNWRLNWSEAVDQARKTGRPIMVQGCIQGCPTCAQLVGSTIKDPKVSLLIKANFVPFAVDVANAPPALKNVLQAAGDAHPYVVYVNDRLQPLHSSSGMRDVEEMVADLEKVLENKQLAMSRQNEADLVKLVSQLEKALEDKQYKDAVAAWSALLKLKGYSKHRLKAYELMDKAQADGLKKQGEAVSEAKRDDYAKARELLTEVARDFAGLPVASEAKSDLEALKLLEASAQLAKDQKPTNWKMQAAQKLKTLLQKYPDSPLAAVAVKRAEQLVKY